jgi:hypothetical protein
MITECEDLLFNFCFYFDSWFPRFIIVRRVRNEDAQMEVDRSGILVKEIKNELQEKIEIVNQRFDANERDFKSYIAKSNNQISELADRVNEIKSLIEILTEKLEK